MFTYENISDEKSYHSYHKTKLEINAIPHKSCVTCITLKQLNVMIQENSKISANLSSYLYFYLNHH